jgi:hypothetical protein
MALPHSQKIVRLSKSRGLLSNNLRLRKTEHTRQVQFSTTTRRFMIEARFLAFGESWSLPYRPQRLV